MSERRIKTDIIDTFDEVDEDEDEFEDDDFDDDFDLIDEEEELLDVRTEFPESWLMETHVIG